MARIVIDEILKKQNKTKYWLAKETGISENAIGKIVNNKVDRIKLETIDKICRVLKCEIGDIIKCTKE